MTRSQTSNQQDDASGANHEPPLDTVEALKALANPARLQIMDWLRDPHGEFAQWEPIADRDEVGVCVSHLQAKSGLAQSTVSSYMTTLERAGLVQSTRIGKWIHYKRNEDTLSRLADTLMGLHQRSTNASRPSVEPEDGTTPVTPPKRDEPLMADPAALLPTPNNGS